MSESVTLVDLRAAVKIANRRAVKPLTIFDGEYYGVCMHPESFHLLKCAQARSDWYNYYRSVRILRRLRKDNHEQFNRFSRTWWHASIKEEQHLREYGLLFPLKPTPPHLRRHNPLFKDHRE